MTQPCKIWIEQCKAARNIEDEVGVPRALDYLIGEKFLDFLEAAEDDLNFRAELPAFVDEIRTIFEPWQLVEYLDRVGQAEPLYSSVFEDEEEEILDWERQSELRHGSADLLLVERAKQWLLDE